MSTLLVGLTILLTAFAAVLLGVYLGYRAVIGILFLMGNRPEPLPQASVMLVSQAHSGD